jgi:hypothetical protein
MNSRKLALLLLFSLTVLSQAQIQRVEMRVEGMT